MAQAGGTAASTNYTITPQDYQYLKAMLTHEGLSTITNDLKNGDTNSAYGQISGLVETWLNRAMSAGTGIQQQMLKPRQLTGFSAANVPNEAAGLDPRIGNMLDAYLQARASGDSAVLPNVNQYLNTELVASNPKAFGTAYQKWYDASAMLGVFGDPRSGGSSSLAQEFLTNPDFGGTPEYGLSLAPGLQLKPSEGDVNAYADFRNNVRAYSPLPPARPNDGGAGITPRGSAGPLDRFSDAVTNGLESAGNTILGAFTNTLGRLPTAQEFQDRFGAIQSGARSAIDQLTDIASSPEAKNFQQATGLDPNQYVLNDIYRLGLNRDVDAPSAATQMEVLRNQGAQSLYDQITNSTEGRTLALGNFYQNNFGRDIDPNGLSTWLGQLASGKPLSAVETQILSSPEAQARGITPDQFASLIAPSYSSPISFPDLPQVNAGSAFPTPSDVTGDFNLPTAMPVDTGSMSPTSPVTGNTGVSPLSPADTSGSFAGAPAAGNFDLPSLSGVDTGNPFPTSPITGNFDIPQLQSPSSTAGIAASPVGTVPAPDATPTQPAPPATPTVNDLYQAILQRAPDPTGLASYEGQITNGVPANLVQAQILASPEAAGTLGPDRLTQLVNDYQTQYGIKPQDAATLAPLASDFAQLVGRPADTPTLQHWDQQIQSGMPLGAVEAQIIAAPEAQQARTASLDGISNAFQAKYGLLPTEAATLSPSSADYAKLVGPGANVGTIGAGPAQQAQMAFTGRFDPNAYLAANPDVAAAHMDPLKHYETYGYNEGRALDPQGDRLGQGFNASSYLAQNPDVRAAGMDPLTHYLEYGAAEGRALPTGGNPTAFTNANTSGGVGNGTWSGTFDPSQYLAANKDVAAAGIDPLQHYLTYGFNEGRALDTAGDKINQGFDPSAYLAQNPDVAASKMDPLAHYLEYGAHEGRALPTGSNPYSFSNFNAAQGLGTGNGSFGLNGIAGGGGSAGITTAPGPSNALDGSGGASGSAFGYTDAGGNQQIATFNPQASEQSYLKDQVNQTNALIAAGQQGTANNPNLANAALFNLGAQVQAQQINGVNPALVSALPTGIGTTTTNVGTQVAPGTYTTVNPIINIGTPVLPGGLNAIAGFGGPLNGGVSFGGHGGFF